MNDNQIFAFLEKVADHIKVPFLLFFVALAAITIPLVSIIASAACQDSKGNMLIMSLLTICLFAILATFLSFFETRYRYLQLANRDLQHSQNKLKEELRDAAHEILLESKEQEQNRDRGHQ